MELNTLKEERPDKRKYLLGKLKRHTYMERHYCLMMIYFIMWRYFVIIWRYFGIIWWYFVILWWYFVSIWWYVVYMMILCHYMMILCQYMMIRCHYMMMGIVFRLRWRWHRTESNFLFIKHLYHHIMTNYNRMWPCKTIIGLLSRWVLGCL